MRWIELNNVEYGECVVLGGRTSILMNDCGSMSQKLRYDGSSIDDCFEAIAYRYEVFPDRFFLLTHYHRDHLCGFSKIAKAHPGYFNKVFIPYTPCDETGKPLLLEYAIYAHMFLPYQSDNSQVNTSCMRIFKTLSENVGADRIFTLGEGDIFSFDNTDYKVLWPKKESYPFESELREAVEKLSMLFASPYLTGPARQFKNKMEGFVSLYIECTKAFSINNRALPEKRHSLLKDLQNAYTELDALREDLLLTPQIHDAREILQFPLALTAYNSCVNGSSIIYHNVRRASGSTEDILMTGDCTPDVIATIWNDLHDAYYVLKAPHHGTTAGYSSLFSEMQISHILISNGEYHAGGVVSEKYLEMVNSVKHCTNNSVCPYFKTNESCCNRLITCHEQSGGTDLALKCKAGNGARINAPCMIKQINMGYEFSCMCDK